MFLMAHVIFCSNPTSFECVTRNQVEINGSGRALETRGQNFLDGTLIFHVPDGSCKVSCESNVI